MIGVFFFQAEDSIRDLVRSRGLGDVYKRQALGEVAVFLAVVGAYQLVKVFPSGVFCLLPVQALSLIHI